MKKTLVVSYTPRTGSHTKKLVDAFIEFATGKTEITFLDLVTSPPDLLLAENLNLILKGRYNEYTIEEKEKLSNHLKLITQVLDADYIVMASPMYNFSLPATVKAWVDAIVVYNQTFTYLEDGQQKGLCGDKKAMILAVSGGDYSTVNAKEYFTPTIKMNFDFMGIPFKQVSAFGVDQNRDKLTSILDNAKLEIKNLVDRWFPN